MRIGVNTYGIGKNIRRDFQGTLVALKEAGVTSIEPNIDFNQRNGKDKFIWISMRMLGILDGHFTVKKAEEVISVWRKNGFEVRSIQADNVNFNVNAMEEVVDFCKRNEILYVTCSFKVETIERIKELLPEIKKITALFRENGIHFLAHNHEAEFKDDNGTNVMCFLMEHVPELEVELDVGWAEYAGVSSVDFMKKYAERISLLHLKDLQPGRITDPGSEFCVIPGTGILPLEDIMKQAQTLPIDKEGYIIDQDNSVSGDIIGDIRAGIINIKTIRQEKK